MAMLNAGREAIDRMAILHAVQNWAMWRDSGNWKGLRSIYTTDATMVTSWFDGSAVDFIAGCMRIQERSARDETKSLSHHLMGGSDIEVRGDHGVAETRVTLLIRLVVHDVESDLTLIGAFHDLFANSEGSWRIHRRVTSFDKDSVQPVSPGTKLALDDTELARFPKAYRYTAYALAARGVAINCNLPVPGSPAMTALRREKDAWLCSGT